MGKQKSILRIAGKCGDKIWYERNGEFFVRSAPTHVNQIKATRRASGRFGRYCSKAGMVRHAFYPELDVRCDSSHINRLNSILIKAAGNHAAIKGFRFNENAAIDRFLTRPPELSRNGILHIPAQDVQPNQFTALEVKAIAVRIDMKSRQVTGSDTVTIMIDTHQPFNGTTIPLYVAGEGTLMLTLQVRGILRDGPTRNKQFLAADIIAVIEPKKRKPSKTHPHPQYTDMQIGVDIPNAYAYPHPHTIQRE